MGRKPEGGGGRGRVKGEGRGGGKANRKPAGAPGAGGRAPRRKRRGRPLGPEVGRGRARAAPASSFRGGTCRHLCRCVGPGVARVAAAAAGGGWRLRRRGNLCISYGRGGVFRLCYYREAPAPPVAAAAAAAAGPGWGGTCQGLGAGDWEGTSARGGDAGAGRSGRTRGSLLGAGARGRQTGVRRGRPRSRPGGERAPRAAALHRSRARSATHLTPLSPAEARLPPDLAQPGRNASALSGLSFPGVQLIISQNLELR